MNLKKTLAMAALLAAAASLGHAGDKPDDSVAFAPTWEDAVAEAKLLNLPIVVHSHGFN